MAAAIFKFIAAEFMGHVYFVAFCDIDAWIFDFNMTVLCHGNLSSSEQYARNLLLII